MRTFADSVPQHSMKTPRIQRLFSCSAFEYFHSIQRYLLRLQIATVNSITHSIRAFLCRPIVILFYFISLSDWSADWSDK